MLHTLDFGGWAIDTPGIRVFRLHHLDREHLRGLFPDVSRHGESCHYPNCTHDHEPDCAVFDAVDRGVLAASRYASYLEMLEEIEPDRVLEEEGEGAEELE
jgi:ribosome biogenesis GTPase